MWVDTHCHLDAAEFDADRDAVAARAQAAGVGIMVVPAVDAHNFAAVSACCRRYAGCVPAWGIHPLYVGRARDEDLERLREQIRREPPVAVGEIGLDFFVPDADVARQQLFFAEQLRIAREFGLPVLLHIRRAQDAVLAQLRRIAVRGGIAHAFNGSRQQAQMFLDLGFKLGFGGALTFPRATRLRAHATELPLESLVLETDAPDIAPAFALGRRNSPEHLPRIGGELAALRNLPAEEVAAATAANARAVLRALPG